MIQYVELVPTKDASKVGCLIEVEVPIVSVFRKFMVKNNSHIRLYYEAPAELPVTFEDTHCKRKFFLAPTGVECPEVKDATYIDSIELYGDTVVFHIYHIY